MFCSQDIKAEGDDVTQAMSKRGALVNVFTPPPPSGNPVSAPEITAEIS